ncbi:hypothetical protein [Pseudomonas aeruginosa]|uniref:hypothetical protein n=1 Tax=Pseudomonas aeruginosa TaxID=287 RepID=UPI0031B6BD74
MKQDWRQFTPSADQIPLLILQLVEGGLAPWQHRGLDGEFPDHLAGDKRRDQPVRPLSAHHHPGLDVVPKLSELQSGVEDLVEILITIKPAPLRPQLVRRQCGLGKGCVDVGGGLPFFVRRIGVHRCPASALSRPALDYPVPGHAVGLFDQCGP